MRVRVPKRSKYGSKPKVGSDGFRYDSQAECRYGEELLRRRQAGDVRMVLRQVPFQLPDGVRLVLDFVWIDKDGLMHFEDVKSPPTEAKSEFRAKRRMVEQIYDIVIDVVWGKR